MSPLGARLARVTTLTTGWRAPGRSALGGRLAQRFRLLGWACATVVSSVAGLVLLVSMLIGPPLLAMSPVGSGLARATVRLTRRFVDAHRWFVGSTLDGPPASYGTAAFDPSVLRTSVLVSHSRGESSGAYQTRPSGRRWRRSLGPLGEAATWRDAAWLLVNGTVGLIAAGLVASLFALSVHCLSLPLQYAAARAEQAAPASPPGLHYLGIGVFDSQAMSFVGIPAGLGGLLLWWWIAPHVLRRYALLSRLLLGPAGTTALTRRIQEVIARDNRVPDPRVTANRGTQLAALTEREQQVLALIAEGRTNAAIAARLFITEKAVDKHINNLFRKLNLTASGEDNRRVLAALAYHETIREGGG
jgi:DNA-binding CsgD family transcriptional regulator